MQNSVNNIASEVSEDNSNLIEDITENISNFEVIIFDPVPDAVDVIRENMDDINAIYEEGSYSYDTDTIHDYEIEEKVLDWKMGDAVCWVSEIAPVRGA